MASIDFSPHRLLSTKKLPEPKRCRMSKPPSVTHILLLFTHRLPALYLEFPPGKEEALSRSHCVGARQCPLACGDPDKWALVLEWAPALNSSSDFQIPTLPAHPVATSSVQRCHRLPDTQLKQGKQ